MRLRKRGHLLEHPASVESREDFEAMSSPMTAFVDDWCEVGPGFEVPVDALWRAHCDWSKSNGRGDGFSKQKFTHKIRSVVPDIEKLRKRQEVSILHLDYDMDSGGSNERVNFYVGIDLKDGYKKRSTGMDGVAGVWPG
jgi:phage/plasmid-associated DNA primase